MTALAKQDTRELARPLKTLEQLIKEDIEAGEQAGMEFYKAAGEKLVEVRDGHFDGDAQGFYRWAEQKFGKSPTTIRTWMALARASGRKSFKSLQDLQQTKNPNRYDHTTGRKFRDWTQPVDAIAERARNEANRLAAEDELTKRQERDAEEKLGLRLIDIGFKVLARELHPDKGGSRDAMARLNRVRDRLRDSV